MKDEQRLPIVDLFRLASILLVFALHVSFVGIGAAPAPGSSAAAIWMHITRNGVYGVSLFFVVSGYVITRSIVTRHSDLKKLSLREFYVRRAGRILPPLLLAILLGALTVAVGKAPSWFHDPRASFDFWFVLSLLTFSFNWLRIIRRKSAPGFGAHWDILWSLAIEEQFYLLYPLTLRTLRARRTILLALMLVVLFGAAARFVSAEIEPSFYVAFTNSFVCFDFLALGCLVFFTLEKIEKRPKNPLVETAIGIVALGVLVAVYWFTFLGNPHEIVWAPTVLGLSAAVLLGVGLRNDWASSRLLRAIAVPGQWSYGAYLFHPLIFLVAQPLLRSLDRTLAFFLVVTITFAICAALYRFFEKPANTYVRRLFKAR